MITFSPLIIAALLMGFFGSPHCLGMCGGLVTAFGLSMGEISPLKKRLLIATYHFSRLLSYAFLGLLAGLIGTSVLAPFMQGNHLPRLLLGLVLALIGLSMLGMPFLSKLEKFGVIFWHKLAPLRRRALPMNTLPKAFFVGILWGFLPCGLVYSALLMAAVSTHIGTSALLMFAFGLGTVPMLVVTQESVGWLHKQIGRLRLRQLNGVVMLLSGLMVIALPLVMQNLHGQHQGHAMSMPADEAIKHDAMNHGAMNHDAMNHDAMNHSTLSDSK